MANLTDKGYIRGDGEVCPVCKKAGVSIDKSPKYNRDNTKLHQEAYCLDCGATWIEVYKLSGYKNLKTT